jgi:hypothetical protein
MVLWTGASMPDARAAQASRGNPLRAETAPAASERATKALGEWRPDVYEGSRADRNKDMDPQSAAALPILALGPDQRSEHKCGEETH